MSYLKKTVEGVALVFLINILAAGVGYVARIVLARNMTVEEYGLFFALFTFVNFLAVFNMFGMGDSLLKFIPERLAVNDPKGVKKVLKAAYTIVTILAIMTGLAILLFAKILSINYFKEESAFLLLILFIPIMMFNNIRGLLRSSYQSFQNIKMFIYIYLLENVAILCGLIVGFTIFPGILTATIVHIAIYILLLAILIPYFIKKTFNPKSADISNEKNEYYKKLLGFGLPVMIAGIGGVVMLYIDTLMITGYRSLEEVGIYNAIVPTVMMLLFFGKSISAVIQPMIAEMKAKKEEFTIAHSLLILEKYAALIIVPAAIVMMMLSKTILKLLFGESFATGANAMMILAASMIPLAIYTIHASYFSALGKPAIATKILLIAAVVNIIINVLLIPWMGIIGASIASFIAYSLAAILSTISIRKIVDVRTLSSIIAWVKIAVAGFLMFSVAWFVSLVIGELLAVLISALLFLAAVLFTRVVLWSELKYVIGVIK